MERDGGRGKERRGNRMNGEGGRNITARNKSAAD